jgi:hypothetical protein
MNHIFYNVIVAILVTCGVLISLWRTLSGDTLSGIYFLLLSYMITGLKHDE